MTPISKATASLLLAFVASACIFDPFFLPGGSLLRALTEGAVGLAAIALSHFLLVSAVRTRDEETLRS